MSKYRQKSRVKAFKSFTEWYSFHKWLIYCWAFGSNTTLKKQQNNRNNTLRNNNKTNKIRILRKIARATTTTATATSI